MAQRARKFGRGALLEVKRLELRSLLVRSIFSVGLIERRYSKLVQIFLLVLFE